MLFTWDTKNLCIVFRQWHVRSTSGLVISLLLVVALAAGYEALRAASRRYENSVNKRVDSLPSKHSLFSPGYRQHTYIYLHHTKFLSIPNTWLSSMILYTPYLPTATYTLP